MIFHTKWICSCRICSNFKTAKVIFTFRKKFSMKKIWTKVRWIDSNRYCWIGIKIWRKSSEVEAKIRRRSTKKSLCGKNVWSIFGRFANNSIGKTRRIFSNFFDDRTPFISKDFLSFESNSRSIKIFRRKTSKTFFSEFSSRNRRFDFLPRFSFGFGAKTRWNFGQKLGKKFCWSFSSNFVFVSTVEIFLERRKYSKFHRKSSFSFVNEFCSRKSLSVVPRRF